MIKNCDIRVHFLVGGWGQGSCCSRRIGLGFVL